MLETEHFRILCRLEEKNRPSGLEVRIDDFELLIKDQVTANSAVVGGMVDWLEEVFGSGSALGWIACGGGQGLLGCDVWRVLWKRRLSWLNGRNSLNEGGAEDGKCRNDGL